MLGVLQLVLCCGVADMATISERMCLRVPIWECRPEGEASDGGSVCKVAVKGVVAAVKI